MKRSPYAIKTNIRLSPSKFPAQQYLNKYFSPAKIEELVGEFSISES